MLDFGSTHEKNGTLHFCNDKGETVKTYPLSELEDYVRAELMQELIESFEEKGEPFKAPGYFGRFEQYLIDRHIDYEFSEVTKTFYIAKNPTEFKSHNSDKQKHV